MDELAIRVENLTFDFGPIRAVDNLTFDIPRGVVFGLLGPNGAGKSTLVRLLLGLLTPSHGRVQVLGLDTRQDGEEIRRRTGALLEQSSLYDRLTAVENLDYHGRVYEMSEAERKVRVEELLTSLGLWDRRSEPIANWSRGMRQKLAVARALVHRPELVILDEPTVGLDPEAAASLYQEFVDIAAQEGISVFLTTHKLADVEKLCAMAAVMRDGKLMAFGPTSELRAMGGMPVLEITGSGFTDNMIALLSRRREVASIKSQRGRLTVELSDRNAHTWPLINLLVESGADIEEVRKSWTGLDYLLTAPPVDTVISAPTVK